MTPLERLEHLRNIITKVPDKNFNIGSWGFYRTDEEHRDSRPTQCETVGCILGHATFDPEFNKEGLTFEYDKSAFFVLGIEDEDFEFLRSLLSEDEIKILEDGGIIKLYTGEITPVFGDLYSEDAIGWEFFGLSSSETEKLFMSGWTMSKAEKLAELDEIIEEHKKEEL